MLGTAVLARLYRILRPTLMTIPWFAKADTWFFYWRDQAYAFVKSLAAWKRARRAGPAAAPPDRRNWFPACLHARLAA